MPPDALLARITTAPEVLVGKPRFRGLRISVEEQLLRALAAGVGAEELLSDYPELEPADLHAAMACAAERVAEERRWCSLLPGVDHRLQALLDQQELGEGLTEEEQAEAGGLVELVGLLTLSRHRAPA